MGPMKHTIIICSLFLLLFQFLPLYGDNGINTIIPLEQLHSENSFIQDMKEKALSGDYYTQSMALYLIERIIQNKTFLPVKDELLSILCYLCNQKDTLGDNGTCIRIRKKAIDLIGQLGEHTRETEFADKPWNILLPLLQEDNIDIVSSSIFALGTVGCNNNGRTIKTIASAVDKWTLLTRDFTFSLSVITAIEKIAYVNKGIHEPEVYIALVKIMQNNDDKLITDKAFAVMNILHNYE